MPILLIVNNPSNWPLDIPGVEVVASRIYLTDPAYMAQRGLRVFNLSKSYRYQSLGYYVSLLAEARGHKPIPNISTIRDLVSPSIIRVVSDDLENVIQKALAPIQGTTFTLRIYFGRNLAKRYAGLSLKLFNLFQAPLLRAQFVHQRKQWQLQTISAIGVSEVPDTHRAFLVEAATDYFSGRRRWVKMPKPAKFSLAVLHRPDDPEPPSDPKALQQFAKAGERLGIEVDFITRDDFGRIPEYDALFIRETTIVTNHTFRFARRAEAEGLVVIDDPESILKCTNKVYLAELMTRHKIKIPRTVILHKKNLESIVPTLGLPCILKQPDSSFSIGVIKVETPEELRSEAMRFLEKSELVVAQEFLPTPYDWRIGVIDSRPLYACKYFMARRHWQIIKREGAGTVDEGRVTTLPVEEAPQAVVRTALKAANLIGNGLYGIDLKEIDGTPYIVEVNDNPSIEYGFEDDSLKHKLYDEIMGVFLRRMEKKKL